MTYDDYNRTAWQWIAMSLGHLFVYSTGGPFIFLGTSLVFLIGAMFFDSRAIETHHGVLPQAKARVRS